MNRVWIGILAVCLGSANPATPQIAPPGPSPARFAYLVDWSGHLTKVRLSDGQVVPASPRAFSC
jgi:hypothetical protein